VDERIPNLSLLNDQFRAMTPRSRRRTLQTSPLLVLGLAAAVVLFVGCQDSGLVHSPAEESEEP
jgi:hypothetical protein